MILKIVQYPDPILKKVSQPVTHFDKRLRKLVDDMFETMYDAPGVGLAGVQVGLLERILVIDVGQLEVSADGKTETSRPDPKVVINPEIIAREGKIIWEEGCLSLPQLMHKMERDRNIIVQGQDADGKPVKVLADDLMSVAFQHEIDHLDGMLLTDRLSQIKRELYKKKLDRLRQGGKSQEALDQEVVAIGKGPKYLG